MIQITIRCKKHKNYQGIRPSKGRWYRWEKHGRGCPGCCMVYDMRHGLFDKVNPVPNPWIKVRVIDNVGRS